MGLISRPKNDKTANFYDGLISGDETKTFFDKDTRYNADRIRNRGIVQKHFVGVVNQHIREQDRVLDYGCGPGTFLSMVAPLCKHIIGLDISAGFVDQCNKTIDALGIDNAKAICLQHSDELLQKEEFDVLIMVDVVHHLEDIEATLAHATSFLKPGGRILIYEPNKLNPLIYVTHFLDENEQGLLRLGTPGKYRKVLSPFMELQKIEPNGIVIGPESKAFEILSAVLNHPLLKPVIGWLNPKWFITAKKA